MAASVDVSAVARFFGSPLGKRMLRAGDVLREKPFSLFEEIDGRRVIVQGMIDACFWKTAAGFLWITRPTAKRKRGGRGEGPRPPA